MAIHAKKPALEVTRPNLYRYHDYREFLTDWFSYLKSTKGLSLRSIASSSGLASGFLPMVLSRKRGISAQAIDKIIPHIDLAEAEADYLRNLRTLSETQDQQERIEAYQKIKKFHVYKKKNSKEVEIHRYLTKWYYVAIREMANLPDFKLEPKWIRKRLKNKVSLKEIQSAIRFLQNQGYLTVNNRGEVVAPEKQIICYSGIYKLAMSQFHKQILELATDSIYNTPSEERNLSTHTLAIPKENFDDVKEILNEALQKIEALGEAEVKKKKDSVYQVSFLAFPLTDSEGGRSE